MDALLGRWPQQKHCCRPLRVQHGSIETVALFEGAPNVEFENAASSQERLATCKMISSRFGSADRARVRAILT
jgi:hypothetical protein